MRAALPIALAAFAALFAARATLARERVPRAVAFGWGGAADTDLAFSEFFDGDHTIALRFMLQYPHAYSGPILAEGGEGSFVVAQADWNRATRTDLYVEIGGKRAWIQPKTPLEGRRWHRVAVVRKGGAFTIHVNGEAHAGPAPGPVPESRHGELVTRPVAFSGYEVSDDQGKTWRRVARGVPARGQWVRRPEEKRFR